MENDDLADKLRERVGKTVVIAFDDHTVVVQIESVDPDGFMCTVKSADSVETSPEFWVSYREVTAFRDY